LTIFSLASCDLLTTREPEEPDGNLGGDLFQARSPEEVVSNLEAAFEEKNVVNYLRCFQTKDYESDIKFTPSTDIASLYPEDFANWDINSENFYISALFSASTFEMESKLDFTESEMINHGNDADYSANYKILIRHNRSNIIPTEYSGQLIFKIINDGNDHWYINFWQDTDSDTDTDSLESWSMLKISFTN
jgi:hypothetical protein